MKKNNNFSNTTKAIFIVSIIIISVALAFREYQIRGGSFGRLGAHDYIYKDNNSRR